MPPAPTTTRPLEGRRALVTGGGRGIGRACALALARAGADVVVVSRTRDQVQRTAEEASGLGVRGLALTADVTRPDQVEAMASRAEAEAGPIDVLVNAAGDAESAPFARTGREIWDRMLAVNLTSVYLCTQAILPGMLSRGWGRVVTVASHAGLQGYAYVSAYCAAKHGAVGLTRAVALEVQGKGVTVNAVCPGYVDTEMTRRSAERIAARTRRPAAEALASLAGFNPSGRLLSPDEVAGQVLRLALPDAGGLNGQAVAM